MKKYAIIALFAATPAFAHIIEPETKFFKDELDKNPEIAQVLQYCKLRGLMSEEACKGEMYIGDTISPLKVEAATKCLNKSGYKYRAALDAFFKVDVKAATLTSHEVLGGFWHTYYANAPGEAKGTPAHRHDWSEDTRSLAGDRAGIEAVKSFKERMVRESKTYTDSDSATSGITLGGGVVPGSGTGSYTKGGSTSTTPNTYTKAEVDEAYKAGFGSGHANPGNWGLKPDIACYEKGNCESNGAGGKYPNPDYTKDTGVAKGSANPKPTAPKEEPKEKPKTEVAQDPFGAFPDSNTSTGGIKTSEEVKEKAEEKKNADDKKGITTPVDDERFNLEWNDCVHIEEAELVQEQGSKTTDPDAKTKEQKQVEAEELLKQGICDRSFYSEQYCHDFENERYETKEEDAAAKEQAKVDQAMLELQTLGTCDAAVLGFDFCSKWEYELHSTKAEEELPTYGIGDETPPEENPVPEDDLGGVSSWGDPMGGSTAAPECARDSFGNCIE